MFTVILHGIEAGSQRQMHGDAVSSAPGHAAAEVFFSAVKHLHSALHSRLAYIAACADSACTMAPTEQMATEYFATLAQSRELLSRAQELAAVNFTTQVTSVFQRQVSSLSDGLLLNFGVSDRAVALASTLPTAVAASNPAVGRLLSAMFFRVLPAPERERLGLTMPTVRALDEGSVAECRISFLCQEGTMTAEVPYSMLKSSLARIASQVRLFWKWRAMHRAPVDHRAMTKHVDPYAEQEALLGAPLNINARAFVEVLDFARIGGMRSVIGDCSVQQKEMKLRLAQSIVSGPPGHRGNVVHCAEVLGCDEFAELIQQQMRG